MKHKYVTPQKLNELLYRRRMYYLVISCLFLLLGLLILSIYWSGDIVINTDLTNLNLLEDLGYMFSLIIFIFTLTMLVGFFITLADLLGNGAPEYET